MQQTTQTGTHNSPGPLADAGTYDYDLPVARGGGQPLPAPRPAGKSAGWTLVQCVGLFFISFGASFLRDLTGWRTLHCYMILYAGLTILGYWSEPRPRQSFPRWILKMVGIWLNCYVGFVTVPESLRTLIPEPLAFGLPTFIVTAALYCVAPVQPDTGQKLPLWQWLLLAGCAAVFWGSAGPLFLK